MLDFIVKAITDRKMETPLLIESSTDLLRLEFGREPTDAEVRAFVLGTAVQELAAFIGNQAEKVNVFKEAEEILKGEK